jgi:multisubunit Na+/H+ antiporter MnhF subunit
VALDHAGRCIVLLRLMSPIMTVAVARFRRARD